MVYIKELDGLRGLAVLIVLFLHVDLTFQLFPGGFIGVDIFFSLSGYLITSTLLNEYNRYGSISLKWFYLRRLARLWPALFLMLVLVSVFAYFVQPREMTESLLKELAAASLHVTNWVRVFSLFPSKYFAHTWSLALEEQFYLIWPLFLVWLLAKGFSAKKIAGYLLLLSLLSVVWLNWLQSIGTHYDRMYNGIDTRSVALLMGSALALWLHSNVEYKNLKAGNLKHKFILYVSYAGSITWVYLLFTVRYDQAYMYKWGFLLVSITSTCFVYMLTINKIKWIGWIFTLKPCVDLGIISYGVYLWHFAIFQFLRMLEINMFEVLIYGSIISILIAILSHKYLEKPLLHFVKAQESKWRSA